MYFFFSWKLPIEFTGEFNRHNAIAVLQKDRRGVLNDQWFFLFQIRSSSNRPKELSLDRIESNN